MELKDSTSQLNSKKFLECHTGIKYFSNHYGLTAYNILGDNKYHPHQEPSRSTLGDWITFAQNNNISIIFADPIHCEKLANALSQELDLEVIYLSPLMEIVSSDDVTYLSEMRKYSDIVINALM